MRLLSSSVVAAQLCVTAAAAAPLATSDVTAAARASMSRPFNREAVVPPQCYTRTDGRYNPCYMCHSGPTGENLIEDSILQERYEFSDTARVNAWHNLFVDRRAALARISDDEILEYVRRDNYADLRSALQHVADADYPGWQPDLDYALGFDTEGFARDGSGWRALRYKPFPGTFWPANGSSNDVAIRLPLHFRQDSAGAAALEIYRANLAVLEAVIGHPDNGAPLRRVIEPTDERLFDFDLDGDGRLGLARMIRALPPRYAGAASSVGVRRWRYPNGTEFLHWVIGHLKENGSV